MEILQVQNLQLAVNDRRNTQKHKDQNQRHILKLTPVRCFIITASFTKKKAKTIKHIFFQNVSSSTVAIKKHREK